LEDQKKNGRGMEIKTMETKVKEGKVLEMENINFISLSKEETQTTNSPFFSISIPQ
jgi:hypothetical protein